MASFLLLLAPIASGKTTVLTGLIQQSLEHEKKLLLVFISPLRSLAQELNKKFIQNFKGESLSIYCPQAHDEGQNCHHDYRKKKNIVLIVTHEIMLNGKYDFFLQDPSTIFVFDEFHLLFHWGNTFRPKMLEVFYKMTEAAGFVLAMTATMDSAILPEFEQMVRLGFDDVQVIDFGNQKFKFPPRRVFAYPNLPLGRKLIYLKMLWMMLKIRLKFYHTRSLIFFQYRADVKKWIHYCTKWHLKAVGLVGGEYAEFALQLKDCPEPDFIFATCALGHGVNLPPIHNVFITYPILEKDLWIQMAGRGGRDGTGHIVYTICPSHVKTKGRNTWTDFQSKIEQSITLGINFYQRCRQKLKVLYYLKFRTRKGMSWPNSSFETVKWQTSFSTVDEAEESIKKEVILR